MNRIEQIKEPFKVGFAALSVIEKQNRQGEKSEPLNSGICDGKQAKQGYDGKKPGCAVRQEPDYDREENTDQPVINGEVYVCKDMRKYDTEKENQCRYPEKEADGEWCLAFFEVLNREYQENRERKSDHDALAEGRNGDKKNELADKRNEREPTEITSHISCVRASFGNHKGEKREGDSANCTKGSDTGKENHSDMIAEHGASREELDRISGQSREGLFDSHNGTFLFGV